MVDAALIEFFMVVLTALTVMVTVLSAVCVAYLNYKSIKTNIDTNKSQVLLQCLREYGNVMKDRTNAKNEKNRELIIGYYRELFDLHWTEFRLWKLDFIEDDTMTAWLNSRYRDYLTDYLTAQDENGDEIEISYKDSWDDLVKTNYFEKDDKFLIFMKYAYDNHIEDALKMKNKR